MPEKNLGSTSLYIDSSLTSGVMERHTGILWSAVFGGALAMIAAMLLLFTLASAFGFASLSPWGAKTSGTTFAISAAIVLIAIQWISAGFGGYMTGRMRTAYVAAHNHEIFFRDTAHGFLTWALATVIGLVLLGSALGHHHMAEHNNETRDEGGVSMHYVGKLFATPDHDVIPTQQESEEAGYVLALAAAGSAIPEDDHTSLVQMVASRTHLSNEEAAQRIENVINQVKATSDSARKYAAVTSLFVFFSMMIGAFIASVAAGLGGQHRDVHYLTGSLDERRIA